MEIDWTLVARYVAPLLALFVGAALNRVIERRPRLISYMPSASAVHVKAQDGTRLQVHSHTIVVRNAGKVASNSVRLGHAELPDFSVYPAIEYSVKTLEGGTKEIVFPVLVPGEQVIVTYLYLAPITFANVNTYTKSDEGFAKIITVLPTPQWPIWVNRAFAALMVIGALTVVIAVTEIVIRVIADAAP